MLETLKIIDIARENGAALFLHGHTHVPALWTENGVTVMNPGTIRGKQGKSYPTCGIIETYDTHFTCKLLFAAFFVE